ncbi:DUF2972 domain-containing protein [Campylobacter jejuni]
MNNYKKKKKIIRKWKRIIDQELINIKQHHTNIVAS